MEDSLCKICNVVQSVDHVLLHCKGSNLKSNRTIFENKFCKYVPNYHSLPDEDKLQIVLNFKPLWMKMKPVKPFMHLSRTLIRVHKA